MGWYGDPEALDAAARRLAADAAAVHGRARALERSARGLRWQGPAAAAFRRALQGDLGRLHRAAAELEQAAAVLRTHAAEVRVRQERLRALADGALGALR